eukprot:ANDGO_01569.mRNA.1 hypothetical protein
MVQLDQSALSVGTSIAQLVIVGLWLMCLVTVVYSRRVARRQTISQWSLQSRELLMASPLLDSESRALTTAAADSSVLETELQSLIVDLPVLPQYALLLNGFMCSILPECTVTVRYGTRCMIVCTVLLIFVNNMLVAISESTVQSASLVAQSIVLLGFSLMFFYQWICYEQVGPLIHTLFPSVHTTKIGELHAAVTIRSALALGLGLLGAVINSFSNQHLSFRENDGRATLVFVSSLLFYPIPYTFIFVAMIPVAYLCKIVFLLQINITEELFFWALHNSRSFAKAASNGGARGARGADGVSNRIMLLEKKKEGMPTSLSDIIALFERQQSLLHDLSRFFNVFVFPLAFFVIFLILLSLFAVFEKSPSTLLIVVLAMCVFITFLYCILPAAEASTQMKRFARLVSHVLLNQIHEESQLQMYIPSVRNPSSQKKHQRQHCATQEGDVPAQFDEIVHKWSEVRQTLFLFEHSRKQPSSSSPSSAVGTGNEQRRSCSTPEEEHQLRIFFEALREEQMALEILGFDVTHRSIIQLSGTAFAVFSFLIQAGLLLLV